MHFYLATNASTFPCFRIPGKAGMYCMYMYIYVQVVYLPTVCMCTICYSICTICTERMYYLNLCVPYIYICTCVNVLYVCCHSFILWWYSEYCTNSE